MEDDDTSELIPVPVLEEHEVAAVFAILVRLIRTDLGNQQDRDKIAELQAAIDARSAQRPKYMATIDAFGFEIEKPGLWGRVKAGVGEDNFYRAYSLAFPDQFDDDGRLLEAAGDEESQKEGAIANDIDGSVRPTHPPPKISDAILTYMRSIGSRGVRVAEIRAHLLATYGIETHEKTPGMTLYRLGKEGHVYRKGREWFAADLKNPDLLSITKDPIEAGFDP